ncbi:MAG: hypothetical protein GX811_04600, partial [Lentisphaerae bacterium]|nr:hypothetical protein [Lentisphaerota bacterium]
DRKADVKQDQVTVGVRSPRGPDAMVLEAGIGETRFRFVDKAAEPLSARVLEARARFAFTNGVELAGEAEILDFRTLSANWRASAEIGYRGMDGWKVSGIVGKQDVRDNYFSIKDGLQETWLGAYGQCRILERIEMFAQYKYYFIDAPSWDVELPKRIFEYPAGISTNAPYRPYPAGVTTNAPHPDTWRDNSAHEAIGEIYYWLSFYPYSLRLWVNGFVYDTRRQNELYWTPEGTFVSGQIGVHWRHSIGRRHFPGAPTFFYGLYGAIGKNTEGDYSPTFKAEIGMNDYKGWGIAGEVFRIWGETYEETGGNIGLRYLF